MVSESKKNIPLQVSKWVKVPLLVDDQEMESLIQQLPSFKVYDVQKVTAPQEGIYESRSFLEKYGEYVAALKQGELPQINDFRPLFSSVWSVSEEALFSLPTPEGRRLLKACEPVVQIQMNQIRYAPEEKVFRTQVYSSDSLYWGIQIGFPHIYLDPRTFETGNTRDFPNMALFSAFQRWIRQATLPTPFLVEGERINSPIRLGKACFSWINQHPQLKANRIAIDRR